MQCTHFQRKHLGLIMAATFGKYANNMTCPKMFSYCCKCLSLINLGENLHCDQHCMYNVANLSLSIFFYEKQFQIEEERLKTLNGASWTTSGSDVSSTLLLESHFRIGRVSRNSLSLITSETRIVRLSDQQNECHLLMMRIILSKSTLKK